MGNCMNTGRSGDDNNNNNNNNDGHRGDPNLTMWTTFMAPPPPNSKRTYMQKVNGFIDRKSQLDAHNGHVQLLNNINNQRPRALVPPARQMIISRIRKRNMDTNTYVYMTLITRLDIQSGVDARRNERGRPVVTIVTPRRTG